MSFDKTKCHASTIILSYISMLRPVVHQLSRFIFLSILPSRRSERDKIDGVNIFA